MFKRVEKQNKTKKQSGGIFEDLMKTLSKQEKTEKSCPINLSGKCVDMVADCSIVLFSTLRRQVFSNSCDRRSKSAI